MAPSTLKTVSLAGVAPDHLPSVCLPLPPSGPILLPIFIKGQRVIALYDNGAMCTVLHTEVTHELGLTPLPPPVSLVGLGGEGGISTCTT